MEIVSRMMSLYTHIDQQTAAYQLKTGLRCPSGCGLCCPSADVHTTVLEMLPVAHHILCEGESALWLERIESEGFSGICVSYQTQRLEESAGHCRFYTLRPTICRLFGFAAVRNKIGDMELSVCKHIKKAQPNEVQQARMLQGEAPCFSDIGTLLQGIEPSYSRLMPINKALQKAIMRMGLRMQMSHNEDLGSTSAA